jgi:hypothetical protein|tara:strand:- start:754 stop:1305 length:552 start_codon:yes stop_codon:yes gene_type:complete
MIKIFDNIIPTYLQDFIYDFITNENLDKNPPYPLFYMKNLTTKNIDVVKNESEVGFGSNFYDNNKIMNDGESLLTPLYLFSVSQKFILKKIFRARTYLQIPDSCLDKPKILKPHKDLTHNHYAMIYYVNDSDGDTIFYDNKENIIKKISPKKGRIAFFNGDILHSGSAPTQNLRIVLNYNFLI